MQNVEGSVSGEDLLTLQAHPRHTHTHTHTHTNTSLTSPVGGNAHGYTGRARLLTRVCFHSPRVNSTHTHTCSPGHVSPRVTKPGGFAQHHAGVSAMACVCIVPGSSGNVSVSLCTLTTCPICSRHGGGGCQWRRCCYIGFEHSNTKFHVRKLCVHGSVAPHTHTHTHPIHRRQKSGA